MFNNYNYRNVLLATLCVMALFVTGAPLMVAGQTPAPTLEDSPLYSGRAGYEGPGSTRDGSARIRRVWAAAPSSRSAEAPSLGCNLTWDLKKVKGTTTPGGTLQNATFTFQSTGSCDWTVALSSTTPAGITFDWEPATVSLTFTDSVATSDGTITVAPTVSPGTYPLAINLDIWLNGQPFTNAQETYTLTVVDAPTPTPVPPTPTPTPVEMDPTIPIYDATVIIEPPLNPATKPWGDYPHLGGLSATTAPCPCPCPSGTVCPGIAQDVGDPIYLHNGEFYLYAVDLRIPGRGFDWAFARKYRSGITFEGPLGHNWDFNYNRRLVLVTADNLARIPTAGLPTAPKAGDVLRMDGLSRVDLYVQQPDGSYQAPTGFYTRLMRESDGGFAERDSQGQVAFYSPPDAQGHALLTALQDRNGNTMRFRHNAQNQLVEVVDTLGRSIQYFYNGDGRLIRVTDFLGRSITFTYDQNGDLVAVTSPAVTSTPNGNDFPQGKTVRYGYSSGFADVRLNHNLVSITAPNEVANGGPPRVQLQYETDLNSPHLDRVTSQTLGGTNATGVPASGTITYEYGLPVQAQVLQQNDAVSQTTVTDRNGNVTEYQFNQLGNIVRVREFTNRDVRAGEPAFYETRHEYNQDGQRTRTIYPEGNSVEHLYDEANPDRLQRGNRLAEIRRPDSDRGGDQVAITTTLTYEPIYNQVRTVTEARGNDPDYVPPNGGGNSPARYTTTQTFDYEESCDFTALAARVGRTAAEVQQLLTDAGLCTAPLGDVNGDSAINQVNGNVIRVQAPTVSLLPGSNQTGVEGDTTQEIVALSAFNAFGQAIYAIDPEGNVTDYAYFPETDPDGDGTLTPAPADGRTLDPTTGGYLKEVILDARAIVAPGIPERRNRAACPEDLDGSGDISIGDIQHAAGLFRKQAGFPIDHNGNRRVDVQDIMRLATRFGEPCLGFTDIRTQYAYDPVGNVIRAVDGRGIATDYAVNALNQVVQITRAAAHTDFGFRISDFGLNRLPNTPRSPISNLQSNAPSEPLPLTDFQYLTRIFYDFNDNVVLQQVEDRGNTSNVDGNPPAADLPPTAPDPDPVGGMAFVDVVYKYDILDNLVETVQEVENGGIDPSTGLGTGFLRTRTRYDPNENPVLVILPEGNAAASVYDERDLVFQATRGATAPPPLALLATTDPTNYDVRGGLPSTWTYHYDDNGNVVETVDAADTDGSAANNSDRGGIGDRTRFIYDGFDRPTSVVDSVGNQAVYQYDPASNLVRLARFGPVGGASPTADGPDGLPRPVSSNGVISATNLVSTNLLAAGEARYDELSRAFQTDQVLFVNTIPTVRPADVADGAAAIGKGNLTPGDNQAIPGLVSIPILGRVTTRPEYDRNSRLAFTVEDDGDTYQYAYDGADRLIRTVDPEGNTVETAYDGNDNLIETRETDVSQVAGVPDEVFLTTYFYDSLDRLQRRVDNLGRAFEYRYDSRDNLVAVADAQGPLSGTFISRRAFAGGALTVDEVNDFGNVTLSFYDGIGRLTRQESILTASGQGDGVSIGADLFGIKTVTPALDPAQGGGDGIIRLGRRYDQNSLLSSLIDDQGNVTLYLYDNLDRRVTGSMGLTVNTAPLDKAKILGPREILAPTVATINSPAVIPAAKIDAQLAAAKARLDAVAALFPPLADAVDDDPPTTTVYGYDEDDNILILEDENDSEAFTRYDALNRTIAVRVFRSGQADTHAGDPVFAPTPASDPANPSTAFPAIIGTTKQDFEYDGLSRMVRATDDNEPTNASDDSLITYAYDSLSRVIEETQQIGARPARAVSSAWRAESLRTGLTYPNGRVLQHTYDLLDRLNTVADQGAAQPIADYDYIGAGRVLQRRYPLNGTRLTYLDDAGTTDVGYDGLRRPVQLRHLRTSNVGRLQVESWNLQPSNLQPATAEALLVGFTHTYDRMNNRLSEEKLHATGDSELYDYDSAYRLIQFERGGLNGTKDTIVTPSTNVPLHSRWTLDGAGNWTQVDAETRQHSSFNEITVRDDGTPTTILSDDSGNETDDGTFVFQWDYANRLRTVTRKPVLSAAEGADSTLIATYAYDPLGRRVRKVVTNPGTTDFYYAGWQVVEERDGADALTRQYVYGVGIDEPLVLDRNLDGGDTATGAGDQRLFYHANTLGSIFALTDGAGTVVEGYQYDAYGRQTVFAPGPNGVVDFGGDDVVTPGGVSGLSNPYMYTGRRLDTETGLYYFRNRYLNSVQGRFVSRDPAGGASHQSLYSYDGIDPYGLGDGFSDLSNEELEERFLESLARWYKEKAGFYRKPKLSPACLRRFNEFTGLSEELRELGEELQRRQEADEWSPPVQESRPRLPKSVRQMSARELLEYHRRGQISQKVLERELPRALHKLSESELMKLDLNSEQLREELLRRQDRIKKEVRKTEQGIREGLDIPLDQTVEEKVAETLQYRLGPLIEHIQKVEFEESGGIMEVDIQPSRHGRRPAPSVVP